MQWIRNFFRTTTSVAQPTGQYDIQEAITCLIGARLQFFRHRRLVATVKDGWNWADAYELDQHLGWADTALEKSIFILQGCGISKHECFEKVVSVFEQLPSIAGDVIQLLNVALEIGQRVPGTLVLRTRQLIVELDAACKILENMEKTINKEEEIQSRKKASRRKSLDSEIWWRKPELQSISLVR